MNQEQVVNNQHESDHPQATAKSKRGGYRPHSGRKPLAPHLRRRRMSVGLTPDNLLWLHEVSSETQQPIARILNDLVSLERARVEGESGDGEIEAVVDAML